MIQKCVGKKCAGRGGGGGGGGHRKVRRAKMSVPSHGPEEEASEVPDGGGEDWGDERYPFCWEGRCRCM